MSKSFHPLYNLILFVIFCFTDVLKSSSKKFTDALVSFITYKKVSSFEDRSSSFYFECQTRARRGISLFSRLGMN